MTQWLELLTHCKNVTDSSHDLSGWSLPVLPVYCAQPYIVSLVLWQFMVTYDMWLCTFKVQLWCEDVHSNIQLCMMPYSCGKWHKVIWVTYKVGSCTMNYGYTNKTKRPTVQCLHSVSSWLLSWWVQSNSWRAKHKHTFVYFVRIPLNSVVSNNKLKLFQKVCKTIWSLPRLKTACD